MRKAPFVEDQTSLDALLALQKEFPNGTPNVHSLPKEKKAWSHLKMQLFLRNYQRDGNPLFGECTAVCGMLLKTYRTESCSGWPLLYST